MQQAVEMNVYEAILSRRSVRHYTPQPVEASLVRLLLQAAVHAPTAFHGEPWAFVVVDDRNVLRELSDRAKPLFLNEVRRGNSSRAIQALAAFEDPDLNIFYDAGTLIVICAEGMSPYSAADCWLAAENLMLAGCAMGLGSCVIGCALPALNIPSVKELLGIPDKYAAIAPIVVGYPAGETPPSSRREPRILDRMPVEQQ